MVKCLGKRIVELSKDAPEGIVIKEGTRVAIEPKAFKVLNNFLFLFKIAMALPPLMDPTVIMMQVQEKPDVTYADIGGCKKEIEKLREVIEYSLIYVSFSTNPF